MPIKKGNVMAAKKMLPPKCFFKSQLPEKWSEFIKVGSSFNAMTVPVADGKPALIYFEKAKKDVPESLAAEEYTHAEQAARMGVVLWYVTYQYQLKKFGYKKAPLELEAKAAGKRGFTPEMQAWWDKA